eukprot:403350763
MNRTNSVEPIFSQPLQVTYHQLLQNKSKIEDELYQTQRQLRRKEGEYSKKIAVYEQKIDQLQEQIEDFREREENMKSMYEKILSALNNQADKQMFQNIDLERVRGRKYFDQDFQKEKEKQQNQIESLELNVAQMSDANQKLKTSLTKKEKENLSLLNELDGLKRSLEIQKKEVELVKKSQSTDIEILLRETENRVKGELCQQIDDYQKQFMQERAKLVTQVESLENQLQRNKQQHISYAQQQEKQQVKELQEHKNLNQKLSKELDAVNNQREILIKEKEQLIQENSGLEQNLTKAKTTQGTQSTKSSDTIKKHLKKIEQLEKELAQKQEEISRMNMKFLQLQKQNTPSSIFTERKNSNGPSVSQSTNNLQQVKNFNVGSKDQQVLVDIQTTAGKKRQLQNGKSSSKNNSNSTLSQNIPFQMESCKNSKQPQNSVKGSRNSNGASHSSMANPNTFVPTQISDKMRTQTPIQERFLVDLNDSHSNNNSQILSSNHKKNMLDSSLNSGVKSNHNLQRYINTNELKNCENFLSRSNSQTNNFEQNRRYQNLVQRSPQDKHQFITQRHGSVAPIDRLYSDSEKAILSSIEIENVVKKMLEQVNQERNNQQNQVEVCSVLTPSQFHNMQTPSQNVSFTLKKNLDQSNINSSKYSSQHSKGYFTVDKEFLTKLENSLRKLAKSNEKIKQIMKEKDSFEQQCLKLRQKVKLLKDEKSLWLNERESLIQANHKMECKLKQAQVILNLESEMQNQPSYLQNNNTTIYDMSHNSSQKTLARQFGQRDVSPGAQSNLTLNIIQDAIANSEKYKNPPMSCRVNDSYDISLRLNPDNSYSGQTRRPMFHNTLDRSLLDQSLITIKRDMMNQQMQNQVNVSQFSNIQASQNQSYQSKFLPQNQNFQLFPTQQPQLVNQQSLNSTFRGITTQGSQQNINQLGLPNSHYLSNSQERSDDQNSVLTSRNFSKSTTNLMNKKQSVNNIPTSNQQPPRQLFKYQSNRSPQNRAFQNYQQAQIMSGQNTIQKPNDLNYSSLALDNSNQQMNQNVDQTQSNSFILNKSDISSVKNQYQQKEQSSGVFTSQPGLRRLNSNKAKDRYYTNMNGSQEVQSVGRIVGDKNRYINHQTEISSLQQKRDNKQILTFDEDEEYQIDESHQIMEEDQQNTMAMSMTMGRKNILNSRGTMHQQPQNLSSTTTFDNNKMISTINNMTCNMNQNEIDNLMGNYYQHQQKCFEGMFKDQQQQQSISQYQDEEEDANMIDTDENDSSNCFGELTTKTNKSDNHSTQQQQKNVKINPTSRISSNSIDNRRCNHTQKQVQDHQAVVPSDERSEDEESVQYKLLNNSNFIPSMHARYTYDE